MQERRTSIANALELRLSSINPSYDAFYPTFWLHDTPIVTRALVVSMRPWFLEMFQGTYIRIIYTRPGIIH